MNLSTGLGIAAIIIAVIAFFVPLAGLFIGWVALLIACGAALYGDKGLSIATAVVCAINFFFLTPAMWVGGALLVIPSLILCLAPIGTIVYMTRKQASQE